MMLGGVSMQGPADWLPMELVLLRGPAGTFMAESDDSTLDSAMARLARGDRSAFTEVFERLWPRTLRLAASILKNDADAADAAQQALARILERASEYDPKRPALAWALGIASWECRTILKRRARRREVPADDALLSATTGGHEEQVERQLVEAAATALGTLSDADKEVLLATFWEEAASVGGATLRKRRERALVRLRAAFRRLYGID
jgi:RNA polymerase sigma-70 factor, ECF subfamily